MIALNPWVLPTCGGTSERGGARMGMESEAEGRGWKERGREKEREAVGGGAEKGWRGAGMVFVAGESGSRWGAEISNLKNTILKI